MATINDKIKNIQLVILDVDGVLTDGGLFMGSVAGEQAMEIKQFNIQDGLGIKLLLASGIHVAVITAKTSSIVRDRMQHLGVKHLYQGQENKIKAYHDVMQELNLHYENICYMGDDLPDYKPMQLSGVSIAVPNACDDIKALATITTQKRGGSGAVREIAEYILKTKGLWDAVLNSYTEQK